MPDQDPIGPEPTLKYTMSPYIGDVPYQPWTPGPYVPPYTPPIIPGTGTTPPTLPFFKREPETTMDVWMIWVSDQSDPAKAIWLESAWDDDTVSENRAGWEAVIEEAYKQHGGANVRITKTSVDFGKVQAAFLPTEV